MASVDASDSPAEDRGRHRVGLRGHYSDTQFVGGSSSVRHRFEATTRLALGVSKGEVIFFVGSGFSIDSEGNSADRLVGRLLAGVLAIDTVLAEEAAKDQAGIDTPPVDEARRQRDQFATLDGLRQVLGFKTRRTSLVHRASPRAA